jgi:hypothetical protein
MILLKELGVSRAWVAWEGLLLADKLLFKIKPRFFRSFSAMEKEQNYI